MRAGFRMDADEVGAGLGKGLQVRVGRGDHQVDVEGDLACLRSAFTITGPKLMFGHEMPVHDVEVQPVGAGGSDGTRFLAQPGEIGGEERGGDSGQDGAASCKVLAAGREGRQGGAARQ